MKDIEVKEAEEYDGEFDRAEPGQLGARWSRGSRPTRRMHVTGQVFRAVGNTIAHYIPWTLGDRGRDAARRPAQQWDPAEIGDAVNASIFRLRAPGGLARCGGRIAGGADAGRHRRRRAVRLRAGRRQDAVRAAPPGGEPRPRRRRPDQGRRRRLRLDAAWALLAPVEVAEYLGLRPTWVDSHRRRRRDVGVHGRARRRRHRRRPRRRRRARRTARRPGPT